jgi:hypothetical protein
MTHANSFDTAAHRLLDDLDTRHDQLLEELDALDVRVEQVLSQYTQVRSEKAPVELGAPAPEEDADDARSDDASDDDDA